MPRLPIKMMLYLLSATILQTHCSQKLAPKGISNHPGDIHRADVLAEADWALQQQPITITAEISPKSAGGKHDFFSQADYFWPDPAKPNGPYINKDGLSNPDNFVAHRKAMIRLSKIIGALASAYVLTHDKKYVIHAMVHLKAWFINTETIMNPNLQFSQAVIGQYTGRNYGIIDTIHFLEVAQGVYVMQNDTAFDKEIVAGVKKWFAEYTNWLTTSKMGLDEKNTKNNHSTCWLMQVACFARLCNNTVLMDSCRERFKNVILPNQMGIDGSFPLETARTKPYGYSLFNLDAMATVCQVLSTQKDPQLWKYTTADGRSVKKGIEFLYPYVVDKSKWPFKPDVMYWNDWPVAHPFLLFGSIAYDVKEWQTTWRTLEHDPKVEEVVRNLPVRHPLIW